MNKTITETDIRILEGVFIVLSDCHVLYRLSAIDYISDQTGDDKGILLAIGNQTYRINFNTKEEREENYNRLLKLISQHYASQSPIKE